MKDFEEVDFTVWKGVKWIIGVSLVVTVLSVGGTYLGVFGKVVSTPANVLNKTLNTNNVIQSYEWFYDVNAAYLARIGQVESFKKLMDDPSVPNTERALTRTDLAAMQQTCRELVTKYNANSQKMNKSLFKGWSLPEVLNIGECE